MRLYVGTYTGPQSKGIYVCDLDTATGRVTGMELAAETPNPSFLALSPDQRFLYCANELSTFDGKKSGAVSAFALDPASRQLQLLNQQPSEGTSPCYISLDQAGRNVLVANYSSGTVAVLPISADGALRPASSRQQHEGAGATRRQQGPHAHSIRVDPTGRFAIAADLGLDRLFIYRLDPAAGALTLHGSAAVSAGAGCRHFAFHPDGKRLYVINELDSTLAAFAWDASAGTLTPTQSIPALPAGAGGDNLGAEVQVHPAGRFLYCSVRGHDSITLAAIDPAGGKLQVAAHESSRGKHPRHFSLSPDGRLLVVANRDSSNLAVFRVDPQSGQLRHLTLAEVPSPVCVRFVA